MPGMGIDSRECRALMSYSSTIVSFQKVSQQLHFEWPKNPLCNRMAVRHLRHLGIVV